MRIPRFLFSAVLIALPVATAFANPAHVQKRHWHYPEGFYSARAQYPEAEPNDECPGQGVACGDVVNPAYLEIGGQDWYTFYANAGEYITVGTDYSEEYYETDTFIELYYECQPEILRWDDDSGPDYFSFIAHYQAPYSGNYNLKVRGYDEYVAGPYQVFFVCSNDPGLPGDICATAAEIRRCTSGYLEGTLSGMWNDYDPGEDGCADGYEEVGSDVVYILNLRAGDYVSLRYQMNGDAAFYIITDCSDPAGSCVVGADGSYDEEFIDWTAEWDGTYYLILDSYDPEDEGAWRLDYSIECPPAQFVRGDVDGSGEVGFPDLFYYMLASHMPDPPCRDAADVDDSGVIDVADVFSLVDYLYNDGPPPAEPFPYCDVDPTEDGLDCWEYNCPEDGGDSSRGLQAAGPQGCEGVGLRSVISPDGGKLIVPVEITSERNLSAFEVAVEFDPTVLEFVGLEKGISSGQRLEFLAACRGNAAGEVRMGGVRDLAFRASVTAGRIDAGRLVFRRLQSCEFAGNRVKVAGFSYLAADGTLIQAGDQERMAAVGADPGSLLKPALALPNPLQVNSPIALELGQSGPVEVAVYNVLGQEVRVLSAGTLPGGHHEMTWDGRDDQGRPLGTGIYYLRATVGGQVITRKVTFVR